MQTLEPNILHKYCPTKLRSWGDGDEGGDCSREALRLVNATGSTAVEFCYEIFDFKVESETKTVPWSHPMSWDG